MRSASWVLAPSRWSMLGRRSAERRLIGLVRRSCTSGLALTERLDVGVEAEDVVRVVAAFDLAQATVVGCAKGLLGQCRILAVTREVQVDPVAGRPRRHRVPPGTRPGDVRD